MAKDNRKVPREIMKNIMNSEIRTQENEKPICKVSKKSKDNPNTNIKSRRPRGGKSL